MTASTWWTVVPAFAFVVVLGVAAVRHVLELLRRRVRERLLVDAVDEGAGEAMLVTGCAIGLGWDGRGDMPRALRREAVRRLERAIKRIGEP